MLKILNQRLLVLRDRMIIYKDRMTSKEHMVCLPRKFSKIQI